LKLLLVMSVGFALLTAAIELVVLRLVGKPAASYAVAVRAVANR
jgi:hypothetical protein